MLMSPRVYCTCPAGSPRRDPQLAMPRSFLVKKPSSTRVPNYGQLETRRRQESSGSCHSWRGVVLPLLVPDGAACSVASCEAVCFWDRSSAVACLSPPLPQSSEAKGEPGSSPQAGAGGSSRGNWVPAAPLRDNQNNLNLLSAFSPLQRRTPNLGSPAEGDGAKLLGQEDVAADPLERFECPDCHKPYNTFSGLARHRQQHCKLQAAAVRKYFNCKHCDKEYASLGALKMHIRTHTLPCTCKICGKAFSRPWLLQGHIRTHTGEKPYTCSHCSRAFADRSNLRAHLQTHSDIKKYQCHACLKTFSRMSLLLRHEETVCCPAT
ncbi:zinc finger protein SNAI3 [Rhineura floridana]|uniref:zinc finger protein SNAI3 n=1 Tax=Rhineura floridana TaxID=261503 RepID=UPI002AC7FCE1|nr:zinc finger protein SNAI3 [Rhineura floridana]